MAFITDAEYLTNLFSLYSKRVRRTLQFMLPPDLQKEADDCLQETFLQAWRSIEALQAHPHPDGWLVVTAKHVAQKHIAGNKVCDPLPDISDCGELEERILSRLVFAEQISEVTAHLSPEEKRLFQMKYVEKLPNAQIMERMSLSLSAVKCRCSRLYQHLQQIRVSLL